VGHKAVGEKEGEKKEKKKKGLAVGMADSMRTVIPAHMIVMPTRAAFTHLLDTTIFPVWSAN